MHGGHKGARDPSQIDVEADPGCLATTKRHSDVLIQLASPCPSHRRRPEHRQHHRRATVLVRIHHHHRRLSASAHTRLLDHPVSPSWHRFSPSSMPFKLKRSAHVAVAIPKVGWAVSSPSARAIIARSRSRGCRAQEDRPSAGAAEHPSQERPRLGRVRSV